MIEGVDLDSLTPWALEGGSRREGDIQTGTFLHRPLPCLKTSPFMQWLHHFARKAYQVWWERMPPHHLLCALQDGFVPYKQCDLPLHTHLTLWSQIRCADESENADSELRFKIDPEINKRIYLWEGRLWTLRTDAILNTTNESMTDR